MGIWIAMYLSIALIDMACDGAMCVIAKRRYNLTGSFFACLFWPITAPLEIAGAAVATKDYPTFKETRGESND